tara:strand:+ start:5081 stop:5680 length:600 start_codon:yes stop_codon:yes gene_type:complete
MKVKCVKVKLPEGLIDIHKEAFEGFFLTSLGPNFLKLYYKTLLKNSDGIIICLFDNNDNLKGFAAGTKYSKGFHKNILFENMFSYTLALLNVLLFRPKAVFRLIKNLNKKKDSINDNCMYAELLSIAVPPKHKGLGYGKLLIKEFEKELVSSNIKQIALTTDFLSNQSVLAFYNKMGYKIYYDFVTYPNRKMYKLIKNI